MDCVESYGPETLARRAFAFDGTVVDIVELPAPGPEEGSGDAEVTLRVQEWFRGGEAEQATVLMFAPEVVSSTGNPTYEVGSRLLVSGMDDWVWYCGFTRTYSAGEAELWRGVFG